MDSESTSKFILVQKINDREFVLASSNTKRDLDKYVHHFSNLFDKKSLCIMKESEQVVYDMESEYGTL